MVTLDSFTKGDRTYVLVMLQGRTYCMTEESGIAGNGKAMTQEQFDRFRERMTA